MKEKKNRQKFEHNPPRPTQEKAGNANDLAIKLDYRHY